MEPTTVMVLVIISLLLWDRIDKLFPKKKIKYTTGNTLVSTIEVDLIVNKGDFDEALKQIEEKLTHVKSLSDSIKVINNDRDRTTHKTDTV